VKKFVLFDLFEALEPLGVLLLHLLHNVRLRILLACLKRETKRNNITFSSELKCYGSGSSILGWKRSGSNPDPGFLWQKNLKKFTAENIFFFKNYNLPIPRPP
jgi:hypothetical protein